MGCYKGLGGVVFFLLLSLCVFSSHTGPSEKIDNLDSIRNLIISSQVADGSFSHSLSSTYFAVSTLSLLGSPIPKNTEVCSFISRSLSGVKDTLSVFYAISSAEKAKCENIEYGDAVSVLEKTVKNDNNLERISFAALSLSSLASSNRIPEASSTSISLAASRIISLKDEEDLTPYLLGLISHTLVTLSKNTDFSEHEDSLNSLVEAFNNLFNEAEGEEYIEFEEKSESVSRLRATAYVFMGVEALASIGKEFNIPDEKISLLSEFFIQHRYVASVEDAFYLLNGVTLSCSNHIVIPLVLSVENTVISPSSKGGYVRVRVTDLQGKYVTKARVFLTSSYSKKKEGTVILSNQEAFPVGNEDDNAVYHFNFLAAKPDAGYYTLEFSVSPNKSGDRKFTSLEGVARDIKVAAAVTVSDCEFAISESANFEDEIASVKHSCYFGKPIQEKLSADFLQHLRLILSVKNQVSGRAMRVHQVFLRFTNKISREEAFFVLRPVDKLYRVQINLDDIPEGTFNSVSGDYEIDVVLGDAFIQNPIVWRLGEISLKFPGNNVAQPVSKKVTKVLPVIEHKFRPKEKERSPLVSSTFVALVFSPLLFLLIALIKLGAINISNFPFSGFAFLNAIGFIACIVSIFLLYTMYWLKLNAFQTFGYLLPLLLLTFFFGKRALGDLATRTKVHTD